MQVFIRCLASKPREKAHRVPLHDMLCLLLFRWSCDGPGNILFNQVGGGGVKKKGPDEGYLVPKTHLTFFSTIKVGPIKNIPPKKFLLSNYFSYIRGAQLLAHRPDLGTRAMLSSQQGSTEV